MLQKTNGSTMKSKKKLKNNLRQMTRKYNHTTSMGCSKSSSYREVHSDTGLL